MVRQTHYLGPYEDARMIYLLLDVYLLSLLNSVLSSLPAPINLSVHSVNFNHVLRWDPGPGTPPGTQYKIIRRVNSKELKQRPNTRRTSLKLKLPDSLMEYDLTVQAFHNQTWSEESDTYPFSPFKDTTIGPPKVSLAGCGNCIQVNISLPEADSSARISDIQKFCGARFKVLWRKHKEAVKSAITEDRSYTLNNLQIGTEYCVQVETKIVTNKNTEPSAWNCTFTSIVEPSRGPVVAGAVAALLMFAVGVLMSSMFCLYYTGFICKLKDTLPRVLIEVLSQGYTLTPERMIPDKISIETETQRRHHTPAAPQPATRGTNSEEDDEEEEEEGDNVYMVRDPDLSSGQSSCQNSVDVSGGNSKVAVSGNCGSLTVEVGVPEDEVTHEGLHQDEAKAEGAEVSLMPEGGQTGVQEYVTGEEEEDKEDVCDSSGNINLFSVTVSALAASEEEEQNTRDSLTDFLKLEPVLPTDSNQTLRHTHSQPESDDQTTVALMLPTQEDFTVAGYEGRRADTCDGQTQHEETQEEEEEFSGYMRHT